MNYKIIIIYILLLSHDNFRSFDIRLLKYFLNKKSNNSQVPGKSTNFTHLHSITSIEIWILFPFKAMAMWPREIFIHTYSIYTYMLIYAYILVWKYSQNFYLFLAPLHFRQRKRFYCLTFVGLRNKNYAYATHTHIRVYTHAGVFACNIVCIGFCIGIICR